MARKKKDTLPAEAPEQQNISTDLQPEPESAESAPIADERPKVWTIDELLEEYFPGAKSVSGGVLAGLQRELRRRNRKNEKGY